MLDERKTSEMVSQLFWIPLASILMWLWTLIMLIGRLLGLKRKPRYQTAQSPPLSSQSDELTRDGDTDEIQKFFTRDEYGESVNIFEVRSGEILEVSLDKIFIGEKLAYEDLPGFALVQATDDYEVINGVLHRKFLLLNFSVGGQDDVYLAQGDKE